MDHTTELTASFEQYLYEKFSYYGRIFLLMQVICKLLPWIYENVGPLIFGPKINLRDYGEWALITGATDGIGKSYANELGKAGKNIESVAKEIEASQNVKTKVLAIDFTSGMEIYEKIADEVKGYDIGILVNNVGVSYDYPEYFLAVPNGDILFDQIIRCNLHSVVYMSKIILPKMLKKQKGIIINLSSLSGTIPTPLLTVYSATKAFIDKFSEDFSHEYYSQGIIVQSIIPAFVATKMTKITDTNIMMPDSDRYVAAAIKTIGYATHSTGYLPHGIKQKSIQVCFTYWMFFRSYVIMFIMKICRSESLKLNKIYNAKQH